MVTALTQKTPQDLLKEIEKTKTLTDKPFGVNFTIIPALKEFDFDGFVFFSLSYFFYQLMSFLLFFFFPFFFLISLFSAMPKQSWTEESTSLVHISPSSLLPPPSPLLPPPSSLTLTPTLPPPPSLSSPLFFSETAGSPMCAEYWEKFKKHDPNTVILHKCVSTRHALKAEKLGCDFISLDGFEWLVLFFFWGGGGWKVEFIERIIIVKNNWNE